MEHNSELQIRRISNDYFYHVLSNVKKAQVREIDVFELEEAFKLVGKNEVVDHDCFGEYLFKGMGWPFNPEFNNYLITFGNDEVFLANSHPLEHIKEIRVLCGFAWKKPDLVLTTRAKLKIGEMMFQQLIRNDRNQTKSWICVMHNTNENTINTWRHLAKTHKDFRFDFFPMSIDPDNWQVVRIWRQQG